MVSCKNCGHEYKQCASKGVKSQIFVNRCANCTRKFPDEYIDDLMTELYGDDGNRRKDD